MEHRTATLSGGIVERATPARFAETLVVSDVHLGLRTSHPGKLLETLRSWRFDRLILAGDILHSSGCRWFCAEAWQVVRHLRDLEQTGMAEIVWLYGNHDRHLAPVVGGLTGIAMQESFAWRQGGRSFLAVHGDRFDWFNHHFCGLGTVLGKVYAFSLHHLSAGGWPKRLNDWHAGLEGLHANVARNAAAFAARRGVDVIVCGHTHRPVKRHFEAGAQAGVTYVNAGSWVDLPASYLSIDAKDVAINHIA